MSHPLLTKVLEDACVPGHGHVIDDAIADRLEAALDVCVYVDADDPHGHACSHPARADFHHEVTVMCRAGRCGRTSLVDTCHPFVPLVTP